MSPIIYTPHDCEKPGNCAPRGTLWQCSECGLIWELDADTMATGERLKWCAIEGPRRDIALGAARARAVQPETPTTPTVTSDMVKLAIETYEDHMSVFPTDGSGPNGILGHCGECDAPIGPHTSKTHALEAAAAAVQAKINGDQDA